MKQLWGSLLPLIDVLRAIPLTVISSDIHANEAYIPEWSTTSRLYTSCYTDDTYAQDLYNGAPVQMQGLV